MRGRTRAAARIGCALIGLVLMMPSQSRAEQRKTYFESLQRAWAVGEMALSRKLEFREGRLLAFPGRITDLVYARVGKPQTVLVVYELPDGESEAPFATGEAIFAVLSVLPQYKFWRDNLPHTPRHEIVGGATYAFTGDSLAPAKRLTKAWVVSFEQKGKDRWRTQNGVLAEALVAGVPVLRQDAVRLISRQLPLTKTIADSGLPPITAFITSDTYPEQERVRVIEAVGAGEIKDLASTLKKLSRGDDAVAAAALAASAKLGQSPSTQSLLERRKSKSAEVRAYASGELGARAGEDGQAFAAATAALKDDPEAKVRAAAAAGLGRSGSPRAIGPLKAALLRGDDASRAAGSALAAIGTTEALEALEGAVASGPTEAMVAGVLGLGELLPSCDSCRIYLVEQQKSHGEQAVKDLIGVVLEQGGTDSD